MANDIYIKHNFAQTPDGSFQQPYIHQVSVDSQTPLESQTQIVAQRIAQQPAIAQQPSRVSTQQQNTVSAQYTSQIQQNQPYTFQTLLQNVNRQVSLRDVDRQISYRTPSPSPSTYQVVENVQQPNTRPIPSSVQAPQPYSVQTPFEDDAHILVSYTARRPSPYISQQPVIVQVPGNAPSTQQTIREEIYVANATKRTELHRSVSASSSLANPGSINNYMHVSIFENDDDYNFYFRVRTDSNANGSKLLQLETGQTTMPTSGVGTIVVFFRFPAGSIPSSWAMDVGPISVTTSGAGSGGNITLSDGGSHPSSTYDMGNVVQFDGSSSFATWSEDSFGMNVQATGSLSSLSGAGTYVIGGSFPVRFRFNHSDNRGTLTQTYAVNMYNQFNVTYNQSPSPSPGFQPFGSFNPGDIR